MPSSAFAKFWQVDLTREAFLDRATKDDLCSLRLVSKELAQTVAPRLFRHVTFNFDVNTFSRRARMEALERVGHHVREVHFHLPHSEATFLPPLVDPETLDEINFHYEPQVPPSRPSSSSSSASDSKYGSWKINDLLVRQYPPLFHAATNLTSFLRAFSSMPCLRHLRISCPDQPAEQRYLRSIVDFALTSLRIAIEQVNPPWLHDLSLDRIHPGGIFYLRGLTGIGTSPASTRVWHRIKTVNIKMETFLAGEEDTTDHLKVLHSYLQNFRTLEQLSFTWIGDAGPCPLSLITEPCLSRPSSQNSADRPSLLSAQTGHRTLKLRHLRIMHLENAILDASQASSFIMLHRKVLREFEFERCTLSSGTWDDALAPLSVISGSDDWKHISKTSTQESEVMDVPIFFTPAKERAFPVECIREQLWPTIIPSRDITIGVKALEVLKQVGQRSRGVGFRGLRKLFKSVRPGWP